MAIQGRSILAVKDVVFIHAEVRFLLQHSQRIGQVLLGAQPVQAEYIEDRVHVTGTQRVIQRVTVARKVGDVRLQEVVPIAVERFEVGLQRRFGQGVIERQPCVVGPLHKARHHARNLPLTRCGVEHRRTWRKLGLCHARDSRTQQCGQAGDEGVFPAIVHA